MYGEALSEAWVLRQLVKALYEHATTPRAVDAKPFALDIDLEPASRKVAGTAGVVVIASAALVSDTTSRSLLFSAPYHQNSGVTLPEDAEEPGGGHEARLREEGTEWSGGVHAVTLRQNLHQFQAGENAWNAASDKSFTQGWITE